MKKINFLIFLFAVGLFAQDQQKPKEYSIEQFYENTRIGGGSFSANESKLLISNDESGIFNLYEINISDGSQKAITTSDQESLFAVDYVPNSSDILYSADKGGNEISHLYLLKPDGTSKELTTGENEKVNFAGWSTDKSTMYYLSNKRDPQFFDLYKMEIGKWEPNMLYENNEGYSVSEVSSSGKFLILSKPITTSENKLFLLNRESEEMTEISKPGFNYSPTGFSKDETELYYTTNHGGEFSRLMSFNLDTKESQVLYETNWDVMYSNLSENDTYRVIALNEDGANKLILWKNASQTPMELPEIKDGNIVSASFSESEELLRLTVGTSKTPNNIYVYDIKSKELKKLTNTLNPEIDPKDLVSAEVVRYKSFDGLEIPAIYYKPLNASAENKKPALVWVHGGPGGQSRVGYSALIQYIVNHGYAVLAVNNRGSSGYGASFYKMDDKNHGEKDLQDVIYGKKWLASQDYINKDQIGIIGGSYGGYMTMAAMTFEPDEFEVGVNIFGVTNWLRTLRSIPPYWESFKNALYEELGDPTTKDSIRLRKISPLFHAENVKNPIMVLQGANDPRVLQVESDEIVEAVKANDVPVEYMVFPDEGHGFIKKENEIKGYRQILTFLDKYLKDEDVTMPEKALKD
ncbi:S9 family peptidase [Christiangramia forsetii]|uniref:Secreted prolyl oligopeptidase family protein n=2 Tax=Christiangramia forsetii TaxID=411153 RepID=A0M3H6_CHRFK|nr:alpha/beta fold hydrolase [Christiangramia forsetii]GGG25847.1 peptidase S9 [Christiangramia forsetii]CAL67171.1 secreted prolyl oligopeptidase family protein [Christiangramia forsetii KT0803]